MFENFNWINQLNEYTCWNLTNNFEKKSQIKIYLVYDLLGKSSKGLHDLINFSINQKVNDKTLREQLEIIIVQVAQ
jgi:hypothetical protein